MLAYWCPYFPPAAVSLREFGDSSDSKGSAKSGAHHNCDRSVICKLWKDFSSRDLTPNPCFSVNIRVVELDLKGFSGC